MATSIRMVNPRLVPGLVQTEDYARTVLAAGRPENLEDLVPARLQRQHVLSRDENPAALWLVLEESVLRRPVGSEEVMRAQLEKLLAIAETPRHVVQIIPSGTQVVHDSGCSYGVLSFDEGADVVHVDGFPRGYVLAEPCDVREASRAYDLLKAAAHGPEESALLIESVIKGLSS